MLDFTAVVSCEERLAVIAVNDFTRIKIPRLPPDLGYFGLCVYCTGHGTINFFSNAILVEAQ